VGWGRVWIYDTLLVTDHPYGTTKLPYLTKILTFKLLYVYGAIKVPHPLPSNMIVFDILIMELEMGLSIYI
jgi:hypothetical protein